MQILEIQGKSFQPEHNQFYACDLLLTDYR